MARIIFFLMLIGAVDMRHEFERNSRIVTLKQGRVQGKLRDLPLQQTTSGGDDLDETYRYKTRNRCILFQTFNISVYLSL